MSLEKNRKFVRAEWQVLSAVAYLMGFQVDNWTEYWLINAFRSRHAGSPNEGDDRDTLVCLYQCDLCIQEIDSHARCH